MTLAVNERDSCDKGALTNPHCVPSHARPTTLKEHIMDIHQLTDVFMWCTILNGGLLIFWSIFLTFTPGLVYRLQCKWFPMPCETFNVVIYAFLGLFKIVFIAFSLVPFIALLIVRG